MSSSPLDPSTDDLLSDSAWMRRLARGLVADEAVAEEVVQDTWATLVGKRPARGYLAAVVRSLAMHRRRGERRRTRREREAAREEALPSAAEVAERAELARRLAQAVLELEEPYRQTVVLRYYDGLASAEIARRAGLPASTVRARLKRGLEALRARLDRQHGGRPHWLEALMPLLRANRAAAPGLAGSQAGILPIKLVLAGTLAFSVAGLAWAVAHSSRHARPDALPAAVATSGREAASAAAAGTGQPHAAPGRRAVPEPRAIGEASDPPAARLDRVAARAVDRSGAGLGDAWLRLRDEPADQAYGDAGGRITLEVSAGTLRHLAERSMARFLEVEVGARGHRTRRLRPRLSEARPGVLELGEVTLERAGAVSGRVVDEQGLGVEGALVVAGMPVDMLDERVRTHSGPPELYALGWFTGEPVPFVRSGPGGLFRLDGVPVGHATVWARTTTSLWASGDPVGIRAGEEVSGIELRVRDEPERTLSGVVVDPQGRPLSGIVLTFTRSHAEEGWSNARSGPHGGFWFAPADGAAQDILAASPSWEWDDQRLTEVPAGTHDLVIAFEPSHWLVVVVQDSEGHPLPDGHVEGLGGEGPTDRPLPRCESTLGQDGRGRLRRPAAPLRVRAAAPGYRSRIVGPFEPDRFPDPLIVTLEPLPAIAGRVLRQNGRPAAHATVRLHAGVNAGAGVTPPGGSGPRPQHISHQAWAGEGPAFVYGLMPVPTAEVRTDEAGRFRLPLPGVEAGARNEQPRPPELGAGLRTSGPAPSLAGADLSRTWFVHVFQDGEASKTSGPHVFDPTRDAELELRLPPGGAIAGRLTMEDGGSPLGWTVRASDGMARIVEAPVAADGAFRFESLHAGGWQVRAFEPSASFWPARMDTRRVPKPDVFVVAGRTVECTLTARRRQSARLRGRMWIDGAPAGPWRVEVRTTTSQASIERHEATLDPDGRFELALRPGLKTSLDLFRREHGADLTVSAQLSVRAGDNDWSLDLETARVQGVLDPERAEGWAATRPTLEFELAGAVYRARVVADDQGRFGPLLVPAGSGLLRGPWKDSGGPGPIWREFHLEPGEIRTVDLR